MINFTLKNVIRRLDLSGVKRKYFQITVLLVKTLIESRNDDTDFVLFAIPQSKQAFRKYLQEFFDSNLTEDSERSKVSIVSFDEYSSRSLQDEVAAKIG